MSLPALLQKRPILLVLAAAAPVILLLHQCFRKRRPQRRSKISLTEERVLIIGASSGIGRAMAHRYAQRGARVGVLGRRENFVSEVVNECREIVPHGGNIIGIVGDFSDADDMLRVRDTLKGEWQGLDTMHICAGVSALQPIMALADAESVDPFAPHPEVTKEGVQTAVRISQAASKGNFVGPLVAALAFIPLLINTSRSPSILLVSSVGAVLSAPTRSLYSATKAASLLLYQGLAIEHSSISFTFFLPATIKGDNFRSSAVDNGPVREADPNKSGLKAVDVADRCITAVDSQEKIVFMPAIFNLVPFIYWIYPGPKKLEEMGRKKFKYPC